MPVIRPMMGAGTALVSLGAAQVAAMVATPTVREMGFHSPGSRTLADMATSWGSPRNEGSCFRKMTMATPER
jgi:hypothetical protein